LLKRELGLIAAYCEYLLLNHCLVIIPMPEFADAMCEVIPDQIIAAE